MSSKSALFSSKPHWVVDGGLATELEKRGFDLKHPLWSAKVLAEDPNAILDVHLSYLRSGADIILTASYQASVDGFVRHLGMYPREAQEVLFFTVELACRAREKFLTEHAGGHETGRATEGGVLIGASVGPYGAILADGSEYGGTYDVSRPEVGDYYAKKIEHLILPRRNVRADFLAFETIPTAREAELIAMMLKGIPWARAWISFSSTEALIEALPKLETNEQIAAVGLNCVSPQTVSENLGSIRRRTMKPIVVYPNGGGSYDPVAKTWDQTSAVEAGDEGGVSRSEERARQEWHSWATEWRTLGARLIGGCCKTGPSEIAAIRQALDCASK